MDRARLIISARTTSNSRRAASFQLVRGHLDPERVAELRRRTARGPGGPRRPPAGPTTSVRCRPKRSSASRAGGMPDSRRARTPDELAVLVGGARGRERLVEELRGPRKVPQRGVQVKPRDRPAGKAGEPRRRGCHRAAGSPRSARLRPRGARRAGRTRAPAANESRIPPGRPWTSGSQASSHRTDSENRYAASSPTTISRSTDSSAVEVRLGQGREGLLPAIEDRPARCRARRREVRPLAIVVVVPERGREDRIRPEQVGEERAGRDPRKVDTGGSARMGPRLWQVSLEPRDRRRHVPRAPGTARAPGPRSRRHRSGRAVVELPCQRAIARR